MLDASEHEILERVPEDATVLDVGGWGLPFGRADWVLDMFPYETRGLFDYDRTTAVERFTAETWVQRDICDHEPWPFADRQFDFVVCSQTLEDLRDPISVCHELQRVAKAGYIECPSRVVEQTWGVHGPWVGYSHHRWLVDVVDGRLRFAFKPAVLQTRDFFPYGHDETLSPAERVVTLWWEDGFEVEELHFVGADDLHPYLRAVEGQPEPSGVLGAADDPAPPASLGRRAVRKALRLTAIRRG